MEDVASTYQNFDFTGVFELTDKAWSYMDMNWPCYARKEGETEETKSFEIIDSDTWALHEQIQYSSSSNSPMDYAWIYGRVNTNPADNAAGISTYVPSTRQECFDLCANKPTCVCFSYKHVY